jgi:hypothetical protein
MASGALVGMTAVLAILLFGLFEDGQVSLLVLIFPLLWGVALMSALAGAGVGWITWKVRRQGFSTLKRDDDPS